MAGQRVKRSTRRGRACPDRAVPRQGQHLQAGLVFKRSFVRFPVSLERQSDTELAHGSTAISIDCLIIHGAGGRESCMRLERPDLDILPRVGRVDLGRQRTSGSTVRSEGGSPPNEKVTFDRVRGEFDGSLVGSHRLLVVASAGE
jgi:hypothetical protein